MGIGRNPPIDVPAIDQSGRFVPDWYDRFKYLDSLDPLSSIPTPPANVSSIDTATGAITLGFGLARTSQALRSNLTSITASLGADVVLGNVANYFDGPSIAQGATGTWFVSGTVTVLDPSTSPASIVCILWDGSTIIDSTIMRTTSAVGGFPVSLSGVITSPAGNLRISCKDLSATTGRILANATGNAKDSTITAVRIA